MDNNTQKKEGAYASLTGFRRAIPIILVALAIFSGLCFIIKDTGVLGRFMSDVLLGLFSFGGYFIPFFLGVHAFFYPTDHSRKRTVTRIVFTVLTLLTISTMSHTIANFGSKISFDASLAYSNGINHKGGGFVGALISFLLTKIFGTVGVIIIAVLLIALYITYFFAGGRSALARALLKILNGISNFFSSFGKKKERKEKGADKPDKKEVKRRTALAAEQEILTDDDFFAADNGMQELKIDELGIHELRDKRELEKNPHLQEKVFRDSTAKETSRRSFYDDSDYSAPARERKINTDYSTTDSVHGLYDNVGDTKYTPKPDDIIYEAGTSSSEASAEEFFKDGFEPFDIKINEELSKKPSSKTEKADKEPVGISEFAEPINTVRPEDIEKARQRADFEMKKRATAEAQRLYREAKEAENERVYGDYQQKTEPADTYSSEPYIPEYMEDKNEVVFDFERDPTESEEAARRAETFKTAMGDYERERDMEFKPYEPHIEEPIYQDGQDGEDSDEELKLTRTILDPAPTSENEELYDDGDDEVDTELDFSAEDDDGAEEDFEDEKIPPEKQNEDVIMQRQMFSFLSEEDKEEKEERPLEPQEDDFLQEPAVVSERPRPIFEPIKKPEPKEEPAPIEKPDYSDYQHPPLDLLLKGKFEEDTHQEEEKNRNAEILVDTLAQFNVRVSIKGVDRGPRITRYEIVPAKGIKVSKVMALYNDIALNLGVDGMRMEAPIPGKSAIGVEIPNKNPTTVLLRDLVESDEFIRSSSKTYACLGKDVTGNPVFADIAKMPHVLVAGATGMGKSVCINAILISILYKARPDEVKFIMIDPKKVEFNGYNGIPHLLVPVVTDVKQAAGTLMWAVEQMEKRYDLMEALEVKKLDDYNQKVRENPSLGEPLPKIIIVIDELNDIMLQVRKPAEDLIMSIAQKARAAGIHLIIGTQRPSVDVITGIIKANIPSRISCKVASLNDSRTILEQVGAEKLLNNGDMLYVSAGAPKALRVQGAFVSDPEVIGVMKFLKSQAKGAIYDSEALEEINRAAQKCSKSKGDDDGIDDGDDSDNVGILNDQQFLDAVELAIRSSKISTSLMQRKIGIGYGKAAKFIDNMESLGIVSEPNGSKPRDVLITKDEWHEMLARRSLD